MRKYSHYISEVYLQLPNSELTSAASGPDREATLSESHRTPLGCHPPPPPPDFRSEETGSAGRDRRKGPRGRGAERRVLQLTCPEREAGVRNASPGRGLAAPGTPATHSTHCRGSPGGRGRCAPRLRGRGRWKGWGGGLTEWNLAGGAGWEGGRAVTRPQAAKALLLSGLNQPPTTTSQPALSPTPPCKGHGLQQQPGHRARGMRGGWGSSGGQEDAGASASPDAHPRRCQPSWGEGGGRRASRSQGDPPGPQRDRRGPVRHDPRRRRTTQLSRPPRPRAADAPGMYLPANESRPSCQGRSGRRRRPPNARSRRRRHPAAVLPRRPRQGGPTNARTARTTADCEPSGRPFSTSASPGRQPPQPPPS
nr:collagen alpha-1(I) chain-like [Peromyscus maniculatus bairdii]